MAPFQLECLYDKKDLEYWQTRYPDNIRWNFNNLILEKLTQAELAKLRNVKLEFPLFGPGDMKNDPIVFYSFQNPPTVTFPIYSIKFLDDISIASSWLELNGYSQETIMDYISLLKHANPLRFSGGKMPPPLKALYIPDDVLDNHNVDDLAQKILKSAIVWIFAHELGHILYSHPGYDEVPIEEAQDNEREADAFATEIFRRIGIPPAGMALLFLVFLHLLQNRGDFPSDAAWEDYVKSRTTHPVSKERLHSIAAELNSSPDSFAAVQIDKIAARNIVLNIAEQMEQMSKKLNLKVQQLIKARALAVTEESLRPRRIGEIDKFGIDEIVPIDKSIQFSGLYFGHHKRKLASGKTESLDCCILLTRNGNNVIGRFNFGVGEGSLEGHIRKDRLYFDWKWGDSLGKGVFQGKSSDKFSGNWGYKGSRDNGGTWTGKRD